MTKETKFISFSEFKQIAEGAGGFEGYTSVYSVLDDVGDIVLPGAYAESIPSFLKKGFSSADHTWTYASGGIVAYPVEAKEDSYGLWVRCNFHSTSDAQVVRVKASERSSAGLEVALSIGYEPQLFDVIYPDDYATELPKYLRPDVLTEGLAKANSFLRIRLLKKLYLYEPGIVPVPALQDAMLTGVKSANEHDDWDGLDTGLSESEWLARLDTAVKNFEVRVKARVSMRTKEGRVLSSANWQALADMCDQMDDLSKRVRSMLDEAKPKPKEDDTEKSLDINAVLNHLLVMDLQLRGVPIK